MVSLKHNRAAQRKRNALAKELRANRALRPKQEQLRNKEIPKKLNKNDIRNLSDEDG